VKVAFDTSVLVAALVEPHPLHGRAICWLEAANTGKFAGECTWHALAETWSVLTRLPITPPVAPPLAEVAIERLTQTIEAVELRATTYRAAVRRCAERGLRSGVLFDALHLLAAEERGADLLVTFNAADFHRLARDAGPRIVVPPDPPAVHLAE